MQHNVECPHEHAHSSAKGGVGCRPCRYFIDHSFPTRRPVSVFPPLLQDFARPVDLSSSCGRDRGAGDRRSAASSSIPARKRRLLTSESKDGDRPERPAYAWCSGVDDGRYRTADRLLHSPWQGAVRLLHREELGRGKDSRCSIGTTHRSQAGSSRSRSCAALSMQKIDAADAVAFWATMKSLATAEWLNTSFAELAKLSDIFLTVNSRYIQIYVVPTARGAPSLSRRAEFPGSAPRLLHRLTSRPRSTNPYPASPAAALPCELRAMPPRRLDARHVSSSPNRDMRQRHPRVCGRRSATTPASAYVALYLPRASRRRRFAMHLHGGFPAATMQSIDVLVASRNRSPGFAPRSPWPVVAHPVASRSAAPLGRAPSGEMTVFEATRAAGVAQTMNTALREIRRPSTPGYVDAEQATTVTGDFQIIEPPGDRRERMRTRCGEHVLPRSGAGAGFLSGTPLRSALQRKRELAFSRSSGSVDSTPRRALFVVSLTAPDTCIASYRRCLNRAPCSGPSYRR